MSFEHFAEGTSPSGTTSTPVTRTLYGSTPEPVPVAERPKDKMIGALGLGLALIVVTMIFREDMRSSDILPNGWDR